MNEIKRLHYRNGMPLGKNELEAEQLYHTNLRRIHNYYFHGCGIVTGLELNIPADSISLEITPGFAMMKLSETGSDGNIAQATEALMFRSRKLDFNELWPASGQVKSLYIWITFLEEAGSGAAYTSGSGSSEAAVQNYTFERIKHHVGIKPPSNNGENLILGRVELSVRLQDGQEIREITYLTEESNALRLRCPGVVSPA